MEPDSALVACEELVRRVARAVRLRRAARAAWRGAFWGALAAVGLLLLKSWLGEQAVLWSAALIAAAALFPAAFAALRPVPPLLAARLADRAYGLEDRLATALECRAAGGARSFALFEALAADAAASAARLRSAPSALPPHEVREKQLLAAPLTLAAALALAPALPPDPLAALAERLAPTMAGRDTDAPSLHARLARLLHPGAAPSQGSAVRPSDERTRAQGTEGAIEAPQYKDRAIARTDPDFASFVKQGDDRLRLLERTERLPDLESDFASSQYRALLRRSRELSAGADPNRLSAQKLAELLREMQRLGRPGGEWMREVHEGLDALEQGDLGHALNAIRTALERLRRSEERQRSGQELRGGREERRGGGAGGDEAAGEAQAEADRPGSYGLAKGAYEKGRPTARLRSTPYDTAVQGQRGLRMPSADTGTLARPGSPPVQLQAGGELGQYRRMMEDAIAREEVPRAYHEQVREYFRSLQER